jgi:adenylate cyclase
VARVLTGFYELCGEIVWEREGLVNKLIGDAVLAVFNFPLVREDHVQRAVEAGVEIQRQLRRAALHLRGPEGVEHPVGIGVGIHSGRVSIGEVGKFCRDFTVIGPVVNLASRLQGAAGAGEVVVSEEVYRLVAEKFPDARARVATVKGFEKPVNTFVLSA